MMTVESSTYQQLQNKLRTMIEAAPKGTKLPAEPQLAQDLGVSRATLREAMRIFESQGMIRRQQGLGTFVTGPAIVIESGLEVLESIETLASRIGLAVTMGSLDIQHGKANEEQAQKLDLHPDSPVIAIRRVILTEGMPSAYLIDVLPEEILDPEDLNQAFTGSVLDLLIKRGKPGLSFSKTDISAVHASSEVGKTLNIQRGDTLLRLAGVLFDQQGHPVDFSYSYFLPGHFRLHLIRKIGGVAS